jgi:hypothetical protein
VPWLGYLIGESYSACPLNSIDRLKFGRGRCEGVIVGAIVHIVAGCVLSDQASVCTDLKISRI